MQIAYNLFISGKVQGVNYRYYTLMKAHQLNIAGWVKNAENGTVIAHIQGEHEDVLQFIEWCKRGPAAAEVHEVKYEPTPIENYTDFTIERN